MFLRPLIVLVLLLAGSTAHAAAVAVARTGDPSPLGLPFSSFSSVALTADGQVVFLGSSTGAFRRSGEALVHIVAAGDLLADGAQVAGVSPPALGPGDCAALRAFLVGGGSRILRQCGSTIDVVVATGDAAPGGGAFAEFTTGVAYGAQQQIAFTAILDDGSTGIFRDDGGGARTLIVRAGGASDTFTALRLIGVAADGRVGFRGSIVRGRDGLFTSSGDRVTRVVEVGQASPVGDTFRSVSGATMNDAGNFAFRGDLGDGTGGVFRVDTSSALPLVQAVVREGDTLGGDVRIRTLASSLTPSINAGGAIAFRAALEGAESASSAVFVTTPDGSTTRIIAARDNTAAGTLVRLRDPVLADDGSLVVPASTTGGGSSLFVYRAGSVSTLARNGQTTDIDNGLERFRYSQPSVRDSAERAVFTGSREGIFVASPDLPPVAVAFVGGPTPLGGTFAAFDPPVAEAPGSIAFGAEIAGSGAASRAIIAREGGRLRVAASGSERVRGGRLVDFFAGTLDPLTRPAMGPRGELAFEATLDFGRTPRALLFRRGGRPQPVVRARRPAPGGGTFESFGTPAVLSGRRMAFVAQVGTGQSARAKLFLLAGGRARALAVQGRAAPGRIGGRFDRLDPPEVNGTLVAFRATIDQAGREGLFLSSRRGPGVLLGTGDPAPGGASFRGFLSPSLGGSTLVFLGRLVGVSAAPSLYRVAASAVPAADAAAPAVETIGVPGGASPIGGTIAEFGSFDLNRSDRLAAVVDLVGASARSALVVVDAGGMIVP